MWRGSIMAKLQVPLHALRSQVTAHALERTNIRGAYSKYIGHSCVWHICPYICRVGRTAPRDSSGRWIDPPKNCDARQAGTGLVLPPLFTTQPARSAASRGIDVRPAGTCTQLPGHPGVRAQLLLHQAGGKARMP